MIYSRMSKQYKIRRLYHKSKATAKKRTRTQTLDFVPELQAITFASNTSASYLKVPQSTTQSPLTNFIDFFQPMLFPSTSFLQTTSYKRNHSQPSTSRTFKTSILDKSKSHETKSLQATLNNKASLT